MAEVVFDHVTRIYPGNDKPSVDDLNMDIKDGEFLVLVGPSGCGKSTTLRMLAGLEEVNKGRILIGGKDVTTMQPKDRDIAMVFQNYALYPHMTVELSVITAKITIVLSILPENIEIIAAIIRIITSKSAN